MRPVLFVPSCLLIALFATSAPLAGQTLPDPLALVCETLPLDPLGGCVAWEDRFDGPSPGDDGPTDVAIAPDGTRLFVTGFSFMRPPTDTKYDYVTVAYDAATGGVLWSDEYDGPSSDGATIKGDDFGMAVAVSPDGETVYVTGTSYGYVPDADVNATGVATIAYDADDGTRRWVARYQGAGLGTDVGRDVVTSPDGSMVHVAATVFGTDQDVALLTYRAHSGEPVNDAVYNGPGSRHDSTFFRSLATAPGGGVFVAAQVYAGPDTGFDYGLLRYNETGAPLGATLYDGGQGGVERPFGLGIAPDGSQVYVTGRSRLAASGYDMATVAFDTDGTQGWVARYDDSGLIDEAYVVQASPDGSFVAVTGGSQGGDTGYDYATLVYDAATGGERWAARHGAVGTGNDQATGLGIDPDSLRVYVTGYSLGPAQGFDMVTIGYDALTGLDVWTHTYLSTGQGDDFGRALAVSPVGGRVFVTGDTYTNALTTYDIATIALEPGLGGGLPLPSP